MTPREIDETIGRMAGQLSDLKKKLVCCQRRLMDEQVPMAAVVRCVTATDRDSAALLEACEGVDWERYVAAVREVVTTEKEIGGLVDDLRRAGVDVR